MQNLIFFFLLGLLLSGPPVFSLGGKAFRAYGEKLLKNTLAVALIAVFLFCFLLFLGIFFRSMFVLLRFVCVGLGIAIGGCFGLTLMQRKNSVKDSR